MAVNTPYRRIIRPVGPGTHATHEYVRGSFDESYLFDPDYAPGRAQTIRAYHLLEKDLIRQFEYLEPADDNLQAYSHRLYELLLRASTEFEANCRAILQANRYKKRNNWTIGDYCNVNNSSRLSEYEVRIAIWREENKILHPFKDWASSKSLSWYREYNAVKHSRCKHFPKANLRNVLCAVSGLLAVLFSQFYVLCLRAHAPVAMYQIDDGWFLHDDSVFAVKPPQGWEADEFYDFDWAALRGQADKFAEFPFQ